MNTPRGNAGRPRVPWPRSGDGTAAARPPGRPGTPAGGGSYRVAGHLRRWAGVIGFGALAGAMGLAALPLERSWGLDTLYLLRGVRPPPPEVLVVAMHRQAARALGVPARPDRWPRALHAELVEGLHLQGARCIAFDLLFDRPREAADDARLAAALRAAGNVALVAYLQRDTVPGGAGHTASVDRLIPPMPALAEAAMATAPFALVKSFEGAIEYLGFAPEGDDLPSLPLVLAARHDPDALAPLLAALPGPPPRDASSAVQALRRGALGAPGNAMASARPDDALATLAWRRLLREPRSIVPLNLYGPPGHIRTIGYDQALTLLRQGGPAARQMFQGRAVLVGLSEFNQPEQRDVYRTPWSTGDGLDISGVELAATALANQLDGSLLRRGRPPAEAGLIALLAALWFAPWRFLSIRQAAACSILLATGYAAFAALAFSRWNLWLPWALPLFIAWPLSLLAGGGLRLREADRQRLRLRAALDRYGPREEVARLARQLRSGDDTVHVACLSTDIEGYTRHTESLSPIEARQWLNRYYETVFPIVRRHGGHVVDHAGDAMVCVWLCGTDPRGACDAALAAALALHERLNTPHAGRKTSAAASLDPSAPTRIGLHFGPVSLGEVGDALHAEQRIVGDIVNTASRIQSANKRLGTRVLVSEDLALRVRSVERLRPLGRFLLSGKSCATGLVDPLPADAAQCRLFAQALQAGCEGRWPAMREPLAELAARWPGDGPTRFLQAWCDAAAASPPRDGDTTPLGEQHAFTLLLE